MPTHLFFRWNTLLDEIVDETIIEILTTEVSIMEIGICDQSDAWRRKRY